MKFKNFLEKIGEIRNFKSWETKNKYSLIFIIFFPITIIFFILFTWSYILELLISRFYLLFFFIFITLTFISFSQWLYFYEITNNRFVPINKKKILILDKIINGFENFGKPADKELEKKRVFKFLEWILIISIFLIGITVRNFLEFRDLSMGFQLFFVLAGFYIFEFGMASFILYFLLKTDLAKIVKMIALGMAILIQIPYIVDFYLLNNVRLYYWPKWDDLLLMLATFYMSPKLIYAFAIGHITLFFLLEIFSCLILFYRSYYVNSTLRREKKFVIARIFCAFLLIHLLFGFGGSMATVVNNILFYFCSGIHIQMIYFIQINIYFTPLFCLIFLKLYQHYKGEQKMKIEELNKLYLKIDKNKFKTNEDIKQNIDKIIKSDFFLYLCLFIILILCFQLLNLYVIYF
ncbi:MAG: hypothetical protein EAX96_07285 [Candidatus Lokiarchaeota archaeon]|nr:hypothetical protein [Candidatus Lokiarchaeota archaeon]